MSIETVGQTTPADVPSDVAPRASASEPSRGLFSQALHDTLGKWSARIGLAWLFVLAVCAIFAPLLANSHPLLMKVQGHWSSPALHYLSPADVLLFLAFFLVVALAVWWKLSPLKIGVAVIVVAVLLGGAAVPTYLFVRPPENPVFAEYRHGLASGRIEQAIFALIPYSPSDRLRDEPDARLVPPEQFQGWLHQRFPHKYEAPPVRPPRYSRHILGTDTNGADLLSNLIHGCRIALSIGFLATAISVGIGILIGGLMGYYVGMLDLLGMRFIEIVEAIPTLFLLITINAFLQHRNIYIMMIVIGAVSWTGYARFVRAEFFTIRKLDYVSAAIAAGIPQGSILFRHMLSNALTPVLVNTTFGVASAILYESVLTFLGIGLVDEASWGGLLQQARAGGAGFVVWLALFPGLAIFLTVYAYNLFGEAFRDALDPKLRKRD